MLLQMTDCVVDSTVADGFDEAVGTELEERGTLLSLRKMHGGFDERANCRGRAIQWKSGRSPGDRGCDTFRF